MRQRGNPGSTRATARERPVVRTNQVLVGAIDLAHERRRHALLSCADEDRLGPNGPSAAAVGAARRPGLVDEQRDARAVNGDVDVLESRIRSRDQVDFEDVLAIGRKHVVDHHAAAGAERRALDVVPWMLRDIPRAGVHRVDRRRVAIADRHPADRRCGVEIRLEQRRRQGLRIRDVVEVRALGVER